MLGVLRFFLASCVIIFHLTAKTPGLGLYAVNTFYVVSGYLITLVLHRNYSFNFKLFTINRFLRLIPTYWVACIVGFLCIYFVPDPTRFHPSYGITFTPFEIISNIFLIPWAFLSDHIIISPFYAFHSPEILNFNGYMFRIVTSSWSVAVEIVCYLLLWLFIGRGARFALLTLILSCIYHWYALNHADNINVIYSTFLAATLPFSIGAIGYFVSNYIEKRKPDIGKAFGHQMLFMLIFVTSFLINLYIGVHTDKMLASPYYYANNLIALFAVVTLHGTKLPTSLRSIGSLLGDMSYPMFLCQFYFGLVSWYLIGEPAENRGWRIFIIGYFLSLVFGFLCSKFIDKPISKIRNRVRSHSSKSVR